MLKKLLIFAFAISILYLGASLAMSKRAISPVAPFYPLKLAGEWLDTNFLTFKAPAKQVKHLELADRRLEEFLSLAQSPPLSESLWQSWTDGLSSRYALEIGRAEYMGEQLALLDHAFIPLVERVYLSTLDDLKSLKKFSFEPHTASFFVVARDYNRKAMKTLLQKHQHTAELTDRYRQLIQDQLNWAKAQPELTDKQQAAYTQAETVLNEGKELEWAYDLAATPP